MSLEIIPIGGFKEIGRNCCAIKVDDELVLLDLGVELDNYIRVVDEMEDLKPNISGKMLIDEHAAPDINIIKKYWKNVKAIVISHGHWDHIGAVPFLSNKFNADIHGSDYTIEVIKAIVKDDHIQLRNNLRKHPENSRFKVSKKITIEFINVSHSIPGTVMVAVHTKYGCVLYANDFKLDSNPVIGNKTNLKRVRELKVKVLIVDSLYATKDTSTPSERVAGRMVKDLIAKEIGEGKNLFITTFSSHISRLREIVDAAKKMKKKPVFIGRSLFKYVSAAEAAGFVNFKDVEFVPFGSKIQKFFNKLKNPKNYVFVVTGHQGEPKATLSKLIYKNIYPFSEDDSIIFSCTVIPNEENLKNRDALESSFNSRGVKVFTDVHVSGHGARQDLKRFVKLVNPQVIIPVHGDMKSLNEMKLIAKEAKIKSKVKIIGNGERLDF
jgi:ribonuclease J